MKQILTTILLLVFFSSADAKTKLIVIYDEDCVNCQNLLQETFENQAVKDKLKEYEVEMYEVKSVEARTYIGNYGSNIVKVPAQTFVSDDITIGDVVIMGFREVDEQLQILNDPFAYAITYQEDDRVEKYLSKRSVMRICSKISAARDAGEDSYEALIKYIKEYADKEEISYESEEELVSKHFMKIQCFNTDSLKMRQKASVFKYSIEKRDYNFVKDALLIRNDDGERICNQDIDFSQTEIIDGKEESLINFIDKILKEDGMGMVHDFPGLKTLKEHLKGCIENPNK